jgi:uncharacterized membrane protein YeaQ/YmgE (transglycosylase-associated protein family)
MSIESIIVWIILGAVAGWIAGLIVKGKGFGASGNIVVGIIGSFIGGWLGEQLGVSGTVTGGLSLASIGTAVLGAVVLLFLIGLFKKI